MTLLRTSEASADGKPAERGEMSSAGLMALLRGVVEARLPGVTVESGADKRALLSVLHAHLGATGVFEAGLALRGLSPHPVLDALGLGSTPIEVLGRWSRLERFGHARHRTRIAAEGPGPRVSVEHFALDGGAIAGLDDLFIWGVLLALLARAGFSGLRAWIEPPGAEPVLLFANGAVALADPVPAATARATFVWAPDHRAERCAVDTQDSATMQAALTRVLRSDLLRRWRIDDVARLLRVSRRSLQRQLADEGTSFSERLHRARIDAACALMTDRRLSLAEIAFCVGFSDQAHFSRLFHRYLDVPPSAYLELLEPDPRRIEQAGAIAWEPPAKVQLVKGRVR